MTPGYEKFRSVVVHKGSRSSSLHYDRIPRSQASSIDSTMASASPFAIPPSVPPIPPANTTTQEVKENGSEISNSIATGDENVTNNANENEHEEDILAWEVVPDTMNTAQAPVQSPQALGPQDAREQHEDYDEHFRVSDHVFVESVQSEEEIKGS